MRRERSRRELQNSSGFTLPELLVVIAIIGMLMSLLLPAINMVRATGRDMVNIAGLREVGFARINHNTTFGDQAEVMEAQAHYIQTPDGPGDVPVGWEVRLLPFMDKVELAKLYNRDRFVLDENPNTPGGPSNAQIARSASGRSQIAGRPSSQVPGISHIGAITSNGEIYPDVENLPMDDWRVLANVGTAGRMFQNERGKWVPLIDGLIPNGKGSQRSVIIRDTTALDEKGNKVGVTNAQAKVNHERPQDKVAVFGFAPELDTPRMYGLPGNVLTTAEVVDAYSTQSKLTTKGHALVSNRGVIYLVTMGGNVLSFNDRMDRKLRMILGQRGLEQDVLKQMNDVPDNEFISKH